MNKEEILEKSHNENRQKDPYEMEINLKASQIGTMIVLIICFVLFFVQILAGGGMNYGLGHYYGRRRSIKSLCGNKA